MIKTHDAGCFVLSAAPPPLSAGVGDALLCGGGGHVFALYFYNTPKAEMHAKKMKKCCFFDFCGNGKGRRE